MEANGAIIIRVVLCSSNSVSNVLKELYAVVADRKVNPEEGSYTCYLFEKGLDKILKIVYDSAANLIYYYDLTTKRFFQPEEYEGYKIARLSSGKSIYNDVYAVLYMGNNSGESFYKLYKEGKPTQILGYKEFRTIYNVSSELHEMKIFGLRPLNGNYTIFFDCNKTIIKELTKLIMNAL